MFSLISLKCFLVAAEELNFTQASKRLYISQQAVSSHISKLESYYGVKLFERSSPMVLTEAGRALKKRAVEIFDSVDNYAREIQDLKDFRQGELTVGITVTRGTIMLPPLLCAFNQFFPQIRLHLIEGTFHDDVIATLNEGKLDLCICYNPANTENLRLIPLFEEKFFILVPNKLLGENLPELNGPGRTVSIETFSHLPFIAQNVKTSSGQNFQKLCQRAGFRPRILLSTDNLITGAALSMAGLGAYVLPRSFVSSQFQQSHCMENFLFSQEALAQVSIYELDTREIGKFQVSICALKGRFLTRAAREFIALAKEIYSNLNGD